MGYPSYSVTEFIPRGLIHPYYAPLQETQPIDFIVLGNLLLLRGDRARSSVSP